MTDTKRKGARSIKEIPPDILNQLNRGEIETANLVERLGIHPEILLENVLTQHNRKKYLKPISEKINSLEKQTFMALCQVIVTGLYKQITTHNDNEFFQAISTHQSDLVRCRAACIIVEDSTLTIKQILEKMQPFATDRHFNVREVARSVMRKNIIQNLDETLTILSKRATNEDENIRRFASEATRPRGVCCTHIKQLKENPELALSILEPLKSDKSKYVQNSVGNRLNDASKTQPEFVRKLCQRWEKESNTEETKYIIKRALRTIGE
ncbi:MAG: DNA alkylation repair protein [Candidatus Peribacteria bacterium]|jgi:3-methyladenine DNA glycosylase AlkC|nr:DNA alkylation repair protein [Candidatus Peribacteria bacterium]